MRAGFGRLLVVTWASCPVGENELHRRSKYSVRLAEKLDNGGKKIRERVTASVWVAS